MRLHSPLTTKACGRFPSSSQHSPSPGGPSTTTSSTRARLSFRTLMHICCSGGAAGCVCRQSCLQRPAKNARGDVGPAQNGAPGGEIAIPSPPPANSKQRSGSHGVIPVHVPTLSTHTHKLRRIPPPVLALTARRAGAADSAPGAWAGKDAPPRCQIAPRTAPRAPR